MTTTGDMLGCGRSLADLSEYLDTGRIGDPGHLADCPECQSGLASLRSLAALGNELLDADTDAAGSGSDDWMKTILGNLRLELRPGRNIPLRADTPGDILTETEGSIAALIRSVADSLPGTAAGKCRLHGDVNEPGAPITVGVDLAVVYGHPMEERAATLRRKLATVLARQTELNITAIDVTITDVLEARNPQEKP
ncbi:Asp23/Gls24 family envelope stress response protein [Arthrobacter sp. 2MCAF15]|uniref:Asp23/Gls24 family envelope stress response protein n=1 Tax=Arthrobacter sp. 2MCAF15 TaxID=3232984 RepID=UPI003F912AD1